MELGQLLKEKRQSNQCTQEQLADKIGVTSKTVSNWETGKTTPDLDSIIRLAKLYELSLDEVLIEKSEVVENIKKIEVAKSAKKYFVLCWITNIIFFLILVTQKYFGELSKPVFMLLVIAIILNGCVNFYFSRQVVETTNQTPYEIIKNKGPVYFVLLILLFVILILLVVLRILPVF